jgi:hypothetical protein
MLNSRPKSWQPREPTLQITVQAFILPSNARSRIRSAALAPCSIAYSGAIEAIVAKCCAVKGTGNRPNEFPHIISLTGCSLVHRFIPKEFVCAIVVLMASALAVKSEIAPLPRERPPVLEDQTSAPKIESERSPCQLQLSEIAEFKSMPPITGPANTQQPMSLMSMQWSCRTIIGWSSLLW